MVRFTIHGVVMVEKKSYSFLAVLGPKWAQYGQTTGGFGVLYNFPPGETLKSILPTFMMFLASLEMSSFHFTSLHFDGASEGARLSKVKSHFPTTIPCRVLPSEKIFTLLASTQSDT